MVWGKGDLPIDLILDERPYYDRSGDMAPRATHKNELLCGRSTISAGSLSNQITYSFDMSFRHVHVFGLKFGCSCSCPEREWARLLLSPFYRPKEAGRSKFFIVPFRKARIGPDPIGRICGI